MSYRVEYNPELHKTYPMKKRKIQNIPIKPLVIVVGFFVILYVAHMLGIMWWVLPGDTAVTTGAFSSMIEDVRSGQNVSDAVFSFCKNVISGEVQ